MKAKRLKALRSRLLKKDPAKLADIIERDLAKPSPRIGAGSPRTINGTDRSPRPKVHNARLLTPKLEIGVTLPPVKHNKPPKQRFIKKPLLHNRVEKGATLHKSSSSQPREMIGAVKAGVYKRPAGKLLHGHTEKGATLNPRRKAPTPAKATLRGLATKFHKRVKRLDAEDRREMRTGTYNAQEEAREKHKTFNVKKGALHRQLGIPQGQKIPVSTLERLKHSGNPLSRKRANFALNFGHHLHKSTKGYKRAVDNKMKYYGDTDTQKKVIRINKKKSMKAGKGELLDTIVHEEQHAKHPMMKEKTVRRKTAGVVKKMTKKQKSKMYGKYC